MTRRLMIIFAALLAAIALAIALAGCSSPAQPHRPAPSPSRLETLAKMPCEKLTCAVRRQALMLLAQRELRATVDVACFGPQPSLCRILIAGTACFAEMVNWYGGLNLDEYDTVQVSPGVCEAALNRSVGA